MLTNQMNNSLGKSRTRFDQTTKVLVNDGTMYIPHGSQSPIRQTIGRQHALPITNLTQLHAKEGNWRFSGQHTNANNCSTPKKEHAVQPEQFVRLVKKPWQDQ